VKTALSPTPKANKPRVIFNFPYFSKKPKNHCSNREKQKVDKKQNSAERNLAIIFSAAPVARHPPGFLAVLRRWNYSGALSPRSVRGEH